MKQMEHNFQVDGTTKFGTVVGTLLIFFVNLSSSEILKTIVLAAIGAIVSFGVSLLLKLIVAKIRKK